MSDAAVIGGGIVGMSAALALAQAGAQVTVWESRYPGAGASGRAHGQMVPPGPALMPLWRRSMDFCDQLAREGNFGWDRSSRGTLILADSVEDLRMLEARRTSDEDRVLDEAELAQLGVKAAAGILMTEGRRLHPSALVATTAHAVRQAGGSIHTGAPVVDLAPTPGGWQLMTGDGRRAVQPTVVIAAGMASAPLASRAGHTIPLIGVRGRILVTEPQQSVLKQLVADCSLGTEAALAAARPTLAGRATQRPGGTFVALLAHQRHDGRLLIGGSWAAPGAAEPHDLEQRIARHALSRLPNLSHVRIEGSWSGTRPCTPDGLPIIDQLAPGLWTCCGHGGEGFIAGPGSALLLSQLVLNQAPFTDPAPFRIQRFAHQMGGAR